MSDSIDLVIKNGIIVDGTGNPEYRADVGLSGDRIALIRPRIEAGDVPVLDAAGQTVSPGFIDSHSHDDGYILARPACDPKILQGVTTEVIGNCGFSLAPLGEEGKSYLARMKMVMGGGDMPPELFEVNGFADYLDILEGVPLGVNLAPLVGHATIRVAAMGWEGRAPTAQELEEMERLAGEAMEAGAVGFSSGLIYDPAAHAATEEVAALARVVGRHNGIYATHMRSEGDRQMEAIEEALAIGRAGGVPAHISHHKIAGKANWGMSERTLARFEQAREEGMEVTLDQYPYRAGSTFLSACLPPVFTAGGPLDWAAKLEDPKVRERVAEDIVNDRGFPGDNLIRSGGFENMEISFTSKFPRYSGRSMAEIAETEGREPFDLFFELLMAEQNNIGIVIFMMDEEDIERIVKHPLTMIGSDGMPSLAGMKVHPRMTGAFPRVLGRFVRERKWLDLPEAVRKMTSLPANTFRLRGRGLLKEGFFADLVIFDPEKVIDQGDYQEPDRPPLGISHVFVNGRAAVRGSRVLGVDSGRVIRRES